MIIKKIYIFSIVILILTSCTKQKNVETPKTQSQTKDTLVVNSVDSLKEIKKYSVSGEILSGQGLTSSLLALKGVKMKTALEISNALKYEVDFRYLKAGEKLSVKFFRKDSTVLKEFIYQPDIVTFHKLYRDSVNDSLKYKFTELPIEKKQVNISGVIETTLNQALIEKKGVSDYIRSIVNGILECTVAFRTDARKGDKYQILAEERFFKNKKLPGGNVLYVSYFGKVAGLHEAYKYYDGNKTSIFNGHYTKNGKALIHTALRYPLDHIHVTSSFGYRVHPVTGKKRFHNGVDYRGRVGEPVYSVASGIVVKTGYDKIGGKKVVIKHADGTQTYYLHLSKILVKKYQVIKSRQIIGKVGRSGRVTGPHLHFGVKSARGKWLNPLKMKMIAAPVLKGKRLKEFKKQIEKILKLLK